MFCEKITLVNQLSYCIPIGHGNKPVPDYAKTCPQKKVDIRTIYHYKIDHIKLA